MNNNDLATFTLTSETDKEHFLVVVDNHQDGSYQDHIYCVDGWQDRVRAIVKKRAKIGSEVRVYRSLSWGECCSYMNGAQNCKKITVIAENLK